MYAEVTCAQSRLTPENAVAEIDRLILAAWRQKLPVYMELPSDISYLEVDVPGLPLELKMIPSEQESLKACTEMLVKRLQAAKSPAFLLDIDAIRFGVSAQIMQLAERFQMQVATLNCAKGALPESSPQFIGTYDLKNEAAHSAPPQRSALAEPTCWSNPAMTGSGKRRL
jgi:indolepyruvate decarboxylase